eukprot:767497-Hanusia_phi.AAC.1
MAEPRVRRCRCRQVLAIGSQPYTSRNDVARVHPADVAFATRPLTVVAHVERAAARSCHDCSQVLRYTVDIIDAPSREQQASRALAAPLLLWGEVE